MKKNRVFLLLRCAVLVVGAGCSLPFLNPPTPAPILGTADLSGLAFESPTAVGTPSPLPSATSTRTSTPDRRWTPYPMPSPTFSPYQWICAADGSPDPCHRVFRDIAMLPDGDGWVVGERGVILRRDGDSWTAVDSPVDLTLRMARALAPDDAWAIADETILVKPGESRSHNVFLRWDGTKWTVFQNPVQLERVIDISFVSADNGWGIAVGDSSGSQTTMLIRWDGKSWKPVLWEDGMNAIHMISSIEGWVVGDNGLILYWNGYGWIPVESPVEKDLDGIAFASDDVGWITSSEGVILREAAGEWLVYSGLAPHPRNMVLDPDGNGWMLGSWVRGNLVLSWTDKEWVTYKGPVPDGEVLGLSSPGSGEFWAAGWVPGRARSGMIWRWGGEGWQRDIEHGPLPVTAAALLAEDNAWAVGEDGLIANWNGAEWTEVRSPTQQTLNAAAFLSTENGWAAGEGGQILHWDGAAWSIIREFQWRRAGGGATFHRIDALAFPSSIDGWAAGSAEGGATLQPWMLHWNGVAWEDVPLFADEPPCICSLSALDFRTPDDGWAVGGGEQALILHWDGQAWTSTLGLEGYRLLAVQALGPDDVWAAGVSEQADETLPGGLALHWNGKKWTSYPLPAGVGRLDTIQFSAGGGWMAGQSLLHWNGSTWGTAYSPVDGVIVTLAESESGALWAVTETGAVLKLAAGG